MVSKCKCQGSDAEHELFISPDNFQTSKQHTLTSTDVNDRPLKIAKFWFFAYLLLSWKLRLPIIYKTKEKKTEEITLVLFFFLTLF